MTPTFDALDAKDFELLQQSKIEGTINELSDGRIERINFLQQLGYFEGRLTHVSRDPGSCRYTFTRTDKPAPTADASDPAI